MKHATSTLLALFGLVAAAPAQIRLEGILGRHIQVGVQIGSDRHGCEPVVVNRHDDHGGDRRGDRRGHDDRRGRDENRGRGDHGYWKIVTEEVHVPGYWQEECVPARYGWVTDHCGRRVWTMIEPECHRRIWVPAHCETRTRRVWVGC